MVVPGRVFSLVETPVEIPVDMPVDFLLCLDFDFSNLSTTVLNLVF